MSLHLERKKGQAIIIDQEKQIEIIFADYNTKTEKASFIINAPKKVHIVRKELLHNPRPQKVKGNENSK